jgi:hypothetical protein
MTLGCHQFGVRVQFIDLPLPLFLFFKCKEHMKDQLPPLLSTRHRTLSLPLPMTSIGSRLQDHGPLRVNILRGDAIFERINKWELVTFPSQDQGQVCDLQLLLHPRLAPPQPRVLKNFCPLIN